MRNGLKVLAASAAFVVAGLVASNASAAVIYSDTLIGTGALNGIVVSTSNAIAGGTAGAAWVGNDATNSAAIPSKTASGAEFGDSDTMFLAFTPQSGNIYELKATLSTVGGSWTAIGFSDTSASSGDYGVWHANGGTKSAWALDTSGGAVQFFAGPGATEGGAVIGSGGNGVPVTVTLDTTAASWKTFVTIGATSSTPFTYTTNPTIGFLGFGNASGSTTSTVKDFSLSTVVPEPASMSLLALSGLALMRRRR